jgi:hypothetical protein
VRRITSGELLKYQKGLRIQRGYGTPFQVSSRFSLTKPNLAFRQRLQVIHAFQ